MCIRDRVKCGTQHLYFPSVLCTAQLSLNKKILKPSLSLITLSLSFSLITQALLCDSYLVGLLHRGFSNFPTISKGNFPEPCLFASTKSLIHLLMCSLQLQLSPLKQVFCLKLFNTLTVHDIQSTYHKLSLIHILLFMRFFG